MKENNEAEKLLDQLAFKTESAWERWGEDQREKIFNFADGYKKFLSRAKTERETNKYIIAEAKDRGFVTLDEISSLNPGAKLYFDNRGRSSALVILGRKPICEGFRLVGSHIDSPRLDLKARPYTRTRGWLCLKPNIMAVLKVSVASTTLSAARGRCVSEWSKH